MDIEREDPNSIRLTPHDAASSGTPWEMDIEREDPNDIRLTPHDAGVIGGPVGNGHRKVKD